MQLSPGMIGRVKYLSALMLTCVIGLSACGSSSDDSPLDDAPAYDNPDLAPILDASSYVELLRHVFDVYTGNAYKELMLSLPRWPVPPFEPTQDNDADGAVLVFENTYVCSNGGTVGFDFSYENLGRSGITLQAFDVMECQQDADVLDGLLFMEDSDYELTIRSESYVVNGPSLQLDFDGKVIQFRGSRSSPDEQQWSAEFLELAIEDSSGLLALEAANTEYLVYRSLPEYGTASMRGSVSIRSPVTIDRWIRAEVIEDLSLTLGIPNNVSDRPWRFSFGKLQITADDGSRLMLDANNGDYDTVDIEIIALDGERLELLAQSWEPWIDVLPFDGEPASS